MKLYVKSSLWLFFWHFYLALGGKEREVKHLVEEILGKTEQPAVQRLEESSVMWMLNKMKTIFYGLQHLNWKITPEISVLF